MVWVREVIFRQTPFIYVRQLLTKDVVLLCIGKVLKA